MPFYPRITPPTVCSGSRPTSTLSDADCEVKPSCFLRQSHRSDPVKVQQHSREEEQKHQREREWNRPKVLPRPATPELSHRHSSEFHRRHSQEIPWTSPSHVKSLSHETAISRSGSPLNGRNLRRRDSAVSLLSFDDDRSSRPSSISSQADCKRSCIFTPQCFNRLPQIMIGWLS
jgi:hypothetical protein